jgi:ArsR family metal-binding transcriptional regulator
MFYILNSLLIINKLLYYPLMYINEVKIEQILPCLADPEKIRFVAYLENDVSHILPYMNSILKGAIYNKFGNTLTINKEGKIISLHPRKIGGGKVDDEADAKEIINWLKDLINYCFDNKDKIEPNFERRQKLSPFDIFKLLPGINCKKCGELTCLAFAAKLSEEEINFTQCARIFDGDSTEKRKILSSILKDAGYSIPEVFS